MASAKFLEGFSGGLADESLKALFTPAFVFWLGGALAAVHRHGWSTVAARVVGLPEPLPVVLAGVVLLGVAASGFVVQQFEFTVLRLLEGYWPGWCGGLARRLTRSQKRRFLRVDERVQGFHKLPHPTAEERQGYIEALVQLDDFPPDTGPMPIETGRLLPTRLGNILRAAEDHCAAKYGLDAIICWPRLWLLLPEATKTELSLARQGLNGTVRLWIWGLLFLIWTPVFRVGWPLLLGLVTMGLAYRWMVQAARTYGDLIEAAFDLYRLQLYQALRWPLPSTPAEERALGQALTEYLWHGSDPDQGFPTFTSPK
jgi:hypothetical protein